MNRTAFLAGAAGAVAAASASATAATALSVGTSRDPNNGALVIVATKLGFFQENGLDVSIKYFPSAGDLVSAMASGALNVGAGGTVPTTTLRAGGFPVVLLAQQADISNVQELVVAADINDPKDLQGKKIGATFGTVSEMLADAVLSHYKIPPGSVTLVNLGPADQVTAMLRGDLSAVCLWEPWCTQALKGGGHRLLSGSESYVPGQTGPIDLLGDHGVLVAAKPWVDQNPQLVASVLRALIKAQQLVTSNPDRAADVVGKELDVPADQMKSFMARNRYSLAIDPKLIRDMNAEVAFLQSRNKLKSPVKAADWVYSAPLKQVAANLVTWSGS